MKQDFNRDRLNAFGFTDEEIDKGLRLIAPFNATKIARMHEAIMMLSDENYQRLVKDISFADASRREGAIAYSSDYLKIQDFSNGTTLIGCYNILVTGESNDLDNVAMDYALLIADTKGVSLKTEVLGEDTNKCFLNGIPKLNIKISGENLANIEEISKEYLVATAVYRSYLIAEPALFVSSIYSLDGFIPIQGDEYSLETVRGIIEVFSVTR